MRRQTQPIDGTRSVIDYFVSHLAILSKQGYCSTGPYNELNNLSSLVKDEFHSLFIQLVDAGLEAEDLAKANPIRSNPAHIIFQRLLFALAICAGPYDERKRHALLKTASYFQRHGYIYEGEHILAKLAEIKHLHLPHQQNPCLLLAQSLAKSSESAGLLLADVWLKGYGQGDVPPHLVLPPSQRAALHSNKYVALEVLSNPTNINSPPDILAQHELHIAAALGLTEKLNGYIEANAFVDPQDAFLRTPLFVTAMHGQDEACLALIRGFANTSIRDIRGRTVLEVAAQGGRLSTVRQLVEHGADINPLGGSTPLHAAIEGNNIEVVHYLLESNALVGIQRPHDRKTAINLAEDRGWPCLAQYMLQKLQYQTGPQDEQPFAPSINWQLLSPSLF